MPRPRGDRPLRSVKQVRLAPGYVDSSTLLFDSDDEGTDDAKSEGEHDSKGEGKSEDDDEDRHIAKKPRLGGKLKSRAKKEVLPPPPDSSCLAYYPKTYAAVQRWNKLLDLPPPNPMSDVPAKKLTNREVDAPEPHVAKALANQGASNKNAYYDETKAGFEKLPGEIRSRCFSLFFPITYHYKYCRMQRVGIYKGRAFHHSALLTPKAASWPKFLSGQRKTNPGYQSR